MEAETCVKNSETRKCNVYNKLLCLLHASKADPASFARWNELKDSVTEMSSHADADGMTELHRIDDFEAERLGEGFFSEVFKVTHKTSGRVMVLKKNKFRSNSVNSLKEIQLMNKLRHANILKFEAVCVHEGQLHALTEFIAGGTLEELIADHGTALRWSDRLGLGADIARGLHYLHSRGMFHRDLTSKNIFMKKTPDKLVAIIGDFGLATRIPAKTEPRLAQVGSPYWMSPECLRGEFYDHQADIFSFGIIMCELIARVEADPDILPRTPNFGLEYVSFSALCGPACPPDFLKLTFTCVSIDPESRPRAGDLVSSLGEMRDTQVEVERKESEDRNSRVLSLMAVRKDSSMGDMTASNNRRPSEKARLHSRSHCSSINSCARTLGEEMSRLDPHYAHSAAAPHNPFTTLPRMREGRKIIGSSSELFSSCVELPSVMDNHEWSRRKSLPYHSKQYSPGRYRTKEDTPRNDNVSSGDIDTVTPKSKTINEIHSGSDETLKIIPIHQRMRKLFSESQDDSVLASDSTHQPVPRRWGSCESGIFSASTDEWNPESGFMSNKSIGSSLLTVSDLEVCMWLSHFNFSFNFTNDQQYCFCSTSFLLAGTNCMYLKEDLRAASALLSRTKRTSSVFSDSLEDISARLDDISNMPGELLSDSGAGDRYEKDIREIVEYFERNCRVHKAASMPRIIIRSATENVRSRKIESLIKKVAENKSRGRAGRAAAQQQQLQVCDGIVRSKLPLFDATQRPRGLQGGVRKLGRVNQEHLPTVQNDVEVRTKQ